jgi:hypothetical protein
MPKCHRIEQDGFVSEYEYEELRNGDQRIFYPVTGHFVRLKDDPKALFLFDDNARLFHSIDKVSFLHRVNNPIESDKIYPRPFITEQTDDEKKIEGYKFGSKIISTGDKVAISYVNGSIFNPLVIGSIEAFGSFYQNDFLLTKPDEWEQVKKRLENDDYSLEYKDDSHGEITLDIKAKIKDGEKKNQGGTGNITLNLTGTDTNGKITVNQKTLEGKITQQFLLDNTLDKNIARLSQGISTEEGEGEDKKTTFKEVQYIELDQDNKTISLIQKSGDASDTIQSIEMDSGGKKISITTKGDTEINTDGDVKVTASGNATVKATKITLNNGAGKILTDLTATPACLFSGKPFPGVPTCEAG